MQHRTWYIYPPTGNRHGPCYTERHAQTEAARIAAKKPKLDEGTALVLWRSLERAGWIVRHSGMKPEERPQPSDEILNEE